ncbi:hypothetical protein EFU47_13090 [Vibrio cholerae]|nr:hypothetical protein [Vibrio cholerae]
MLADNVIMLKKTHLSLLLGLTLATPALANNFNYNFLEFITAMNPESGGVEFSTYFTDNSHFIARIDSQLDSDWDIAGGIGFNGPINQFADVYGQMLVHNIRMPKELGGEKDTQLEFNLGARAWLTNQVEGHLRLGRLDDHSVFIAGVRFHSTDQLSLSAEARNAGVWGPQVGMGVRFQF